MSDITLSLSVFLPGFNFNSSVPVTAGESPTQNPTEAPTEAPAQNPGDPGGLVADFHSYMINTQYGQGPYPSSYLKYGIGSLLAIRITFTQNFTFSNANAKLPILIGNTEYLCSYLEMYPDTGGAYADTYTHYFGLNIPEGSFGDITLFSNPIQLNGAQLTGTSGESITLGSTPSTQVSRPYTVNGIRPTPPIIESVDHETGLVNVSGVPLTDPDGYKNRLSWSFDYGATFPSSSSHYSDVNNMLLPAGDWPAGSIGVKVVDTAGNKSNPSFNTDRILVGNGGENPTQNPLRANLSASFPVISVSGTLKGPLRANLAASFPEISVSGALKGPLRANLSASFPEISVSGALKGPLRANLAASFPEISVSGTLKGPLRANLAASFPEISVSGTLKGPLSVNLSPSFPEITLTGRLVNQSKIVRRSLTIAYDANILSVLKTLAYGNAVVLNSALLTPYQSYVTSSRNIIFAYDLPEYYTTNKSLTSTWFAKVILSNTLINAYENCPVIERELVNSVGFCEAVEKSMLAEYEQLRTVGASVLLPYALTYPVCASVGSMYDLLSVNKTAKSLLLPATFEGDINAYFAQPPNASIIGLLGSIDPIRMEVSTSITESVWQVNAQIPYDQSPKAILGERAIASFNALSFSVEFAGKSRSVNVSSDTVNIEAYSPTRSLAFEPAPNFSGKKAIRTLKDLGVNDVIGLADSDIKNTTANQTKLSLINAIAADMGAALMSDPSAKLNVIPSWKASGQQWTVNEDMILEYNEVFVDGPAYNRIVVSDSNSIASGLRTEVVKDEANVDDWLIYVYGGVNVSVSHTQEYGSITPLGDQVLIKSEQVELINGVANLGYEATALISVDWLHNQINSPLSIDGQRLLCGSDGDFALVKVDYSVKATVFKLTYSKDEPIQLVIKGD